ncbi:hypothetical protein ABVT39_020619 [Epinephelus coioides]
MELTPAGSDLMSDSWRSEGAHPLTHLWFQRMESAQRFLLRRTPPNHGDSNRDRNTETSSSKRDLHELRAQTNTELIASEEVSAQTESGCRADNAHHAELKEYRVATFADTVLI